MEGTHAGATGSADAADIARALVAIRRSSARRAFSRLAHERGAGASDLLPDAVLGLLDAVEEATGDGPGVTVTQAALALGVDQPRASRLVAQAVDAGLLRRSADQRDGRRSLLVLTVAGRKALERVHAFRRGVVVEATTGWAPGEVAQLARLITRLVEDLARITAIRQPPTHTP